MRYYLNVNGNKYGPFPPLELIKRNVNGNTLVMRENEKEWIRISEDEFLFEFIVNPQEAAKKDKTNYSEVNTSSQVGNSIGSAIFDSLFKGCFGIFCFGIITTLTLISFIINSF